MPLDDYSGDPWGALLVGVIIIGVPLLIAYVLDVRRTIRDLRSHVRNLEHALELWKDADRKRRGVSGADPADSGRS